ncbi:MAG: DUF1043 family protein [Porticoccaceae bacterium]|nr:DUF1043 family protein [Porticoccaceae bacterium]
MTTLTSILIAAGLFLAGVAVGHFFSKKVDQGDKSVRDIEKKLEKSEQKLKRYQQEVTEHFVAVSHLTSNVAQSYKQIHEHLATSAIRLASPEVGRQLLKSGGSDLNMLDSNGNPLVDIDDIEVPRDYAPSVPGGILNEGYGLSENDQSNEQPDSAANSVASEDDEEADPTQSVG